MKKFVLFLFLTAVLCSVVFGQSLDTTAVKKIVGNGNKPIIMAIDNQTKLIKDSIIAKVAKVNTVVVKPSVVIADLIIFLPVSLFLSILIIVLFKLKKDGVKLSDFLIDKDVKVAIKKEEATAITANSNAIIATANAIKANAAAFAAANAAPQEIPSPIATDAGNNSNAEKHDQSTSRLVAFISGITSVALATCITSFYFYRSFLGDTNVSIGNLATVLYGLGLGIIPYGFNKIAGALK
jgi:hypothetical protein